ncbi:MAG: tetratricopeptide repeat protein [Terriglobales bacterium]
MAFGFGFNKQKVLSAAEKFVQQGKLQNAIAEYEKVLKHDAKDLTVNNTIGDLYSRLGDSAKAIECFKTVGDAYAAQGFTVKGIAMYKKITKLQPSVDSSLKLAELYTQQGLFNDARAQYLQVAEDFMKNGDLDQSVRLFQKVLEMDPENVPMRVKLAEVYVRLHKKKEAWDIFSAAAESLRSRGSLAAAEDIFKRMLVLEPGNSYVLLLRGKSALEVEDPKTAISYLEKASDIDSHPDGLRDLLKAYLQIGALPKAAPIAEKLLTVHNDPEGLFLLAEGCARLGQHREALEVYSRHADRLLATNSTKLLASLHSMIGHVRDDSGALDTLLQLLNKAGDKTHVNEVTELLAHTSVKDGKLARARDLYQMLATAEPENPVHMQNCQQVLGLMAGGSAAIGITAEEGAVIVEELEATAPVIEQVYPDHIAIAVRSAITDADLFLSYNLPEKAIVPLLGVLPQATRDARLNQRLAGLHTRFQRFAEAAACCRTLESVYHDAGYPDEALRYGALAARYEKAAEPVPSSSTSWPSTLSTAAAAAADAAVPPAPRPATAAASDQEFAVEQMAAHAPSDPHKLSSDLNDLASEWERSLAEGQDPAELSVVAEGEAGSDASSNPEIVETVEEIRFYLEHSMTDQARVGMEKLESLTSDARILNPLRAALQSATQPADEPEPVITEITADEPTDFEVAIENQEGSEIPTSPDLMGYQHQTHGESHTEVPAELVQETAYADSHSAEPAPTEALTTEGELTALVADLEASLGDSFPQAEPPAVQPPAVRLPAKQRSRRRAAKAPSLPSWPVSPSPDSSPTPEPEMEPVASASSTGAPSIDSSSTNIEVEIPTIHAAMPAIPASSGGAAAAPARSVPAMPAPATTVPAAIVHAPAIPVPAAPAPTVSAMSYSAASVRPLGNEAEAMHPAGSVDLSEMFGELKQELEEEVIAGDDDPETHYNLGVAFREMGLLDEAIAELQKVCTAIERGKAFGQPVQTYTWLAQCFIDKGVPEAAIRWYEKALSLPGLDDQVLLAINYELGSACEIANDKPAALRYFTGVYGANIDYRDVAERIQALKS